MPRRTDKPYEAVLQYFKTAPIAEANLILDLAKRELKDREATGAAIALGRQKAAQRPSPVAQVPAPKAAAAAVPPAPQAKKKPGPKAGSKSHKKKVVSEPPPAPPTEEFPAYEEPQPEPVPA